ncbi:MAG: hypothetical protein AAFX50_20465, partial [Acidobacteriota bacterium]
CAADPLGATLELSEANNACSNTVVVTTGATGPDLTVAKSNDVGGTTELAAGAFTWSLQVTNGGDQDATFSDGQTVLTDELPTSGLGYAAPAVGDVLDVTGSEFISCGISGDILTCTADGGAVTLASTTGAFVVSFDATPSAIGVYANPRQDGTCAVDPAGVVTEGDEGNNACGDSVEVVGSPNLTATKTNDASDNGATPTTGVPFTWSIRVENEGSADLNFSSGLPILLDGLPNSGMTYGEPVIAQTSGLTSGGFACSVATDTLTCSSTSAAVLAPGGFITVEIDATPTAPGTFVNPRANSTCIADPIDQDREIDETDNECSDTVVVPAQAALTLTKVDGADPVTAGEPLTYAVTAANAGPDAADGVTVFDVLPDGVGFDAASSSAGCTQPAGLEGLLAGLDAAATSPPSGSSTTGSAIFVLDAASLELRFALSLSG